MKTPLNYTGNKSRLVSEFIKHFPEKVKVFVDLFCGGATVGLSVNAEKVIFIDNNESVIGLLKHLSRYKYEILIKRLEKIIDKYNLSYSAKNGYDFYRKYLLQDNNGFKKFNIVGYYKLREEYNLLKNKKTIKAFDMLYILVVYSFNNDMRFNKLGHFNLPVGKTDLNKSNVEKLKNYIKRVSEINCEFIAGDFRNEHVRKILLEADFIYADPPYLITDAVYNETSNWTSDTERDLVDLLQNLQNKGRKFALSNVISKRGRVNNVLKEWIFKRTDLHVINIDYHYRGASYNKIDRGANEKEVLIKNY